MPQPVSLILPKLQPLILDGSNGVRSQLLKLLRALPRHDVEDHTAQLLPYVRAGMTHLAADIRLSSIDILSWLLETAGQDVVSCSGGWVKTISCFCSVLGWHADDTAKWSSNRPSFGKAGTEGKPMVKTLQCLADFLRTGMGDPTDSAAQEFVGSEAGWRFPLWDTQQHLIPKKSNPYGHLNLFGSARDEDTEMYEDRDGRIRVFVRTFQAQVQKGLEAARKEGGELGRYAAMAQKVLEEGFEGYEVD
jgi:pre-rRNA-processing protein IPI1